MADVSTQNEVIQYVVSQAQKTPAIKRIILFGSRARGDAKARSDFDFAFECPDMDYGSWAQFCLNLEESIPTLCRVDLLRLDSKIEKDFLHHINNEGIVIYGRKKD